MKTAQIEECPCVYCKASNWCETECLVFTRWVDLGTWEYIPSLGFSKAVIRTKKKSKPYLVKLGEDAKWGGGPREWINLL